MKLTISKDANINYLAKVIKLEESNFSTHPNADKLKLVHLYGNIISTGIDTQPGYFIYFPVECVIASEFLKFNNLYKDQTLNTNISEKGFFEKSGRVRYVKLRGIASEGFIMSYIALYRFAVNPSTNPTNILEIYEEAKSLVNTTFDTIDDIKFVWKYNVPIKNIGVNLNGKSKKSIINDKILDDQFRFHIDTPKLQNNIYSINPNDLIQISIKQYGTSAIFCNLLTKKNLNWKEKLINKFGINIINSEYAIFCASRRVIKDPILNLKDIKSFYNYDIWSLGLETVKDFLSSGMTIYAEIVGYMPTGVAIQGGWDYKCIYDPKRYKYTEMSATEMYQSHLFDVIIYRITTTNINGKVHEYSAKQVHDWCIENNLHPVTELYYGKAKALFDLDPINNWHENFISKLKDTYLEGDSILCNNNVPEEGIVIRKETTNINVFKLKSTRFLQKETLELDKGTLDIESI
ncbi:hypothetical protein [Clostridium sp.]|uniref:hypothetical protein n=1 Tax=Clostridium sp. TaxID=1506 RepID=UPI002FC6F9FB